MKTTSLIENITCSHHLHGKTKLAHCVSGKSGVTADVEDNSVLFTEPVNKKRLEHWKSYRYVQKEMSQIDKVKPVLQWIPFGVVPLTFEHELPER